MWYLMNNNLKQKVLQDNIIAHDIEYKTYNSTQITIFNKSEQLRIIKMLKNKSKNGDRILDIGSGTGNITLKLEKIRKEIVSTDVSKKMISYLKTKSKNSKTYFMICKGEDLPFKNNVFDMVTGYSVMHHIYSPFGCVKEVRRVMNNKACAIFDHEPFVAKNNAVKFLHVIYSFFLL